MIALTDTYFEEYSLSLSKRGEEVSETEKTSSLHCSSERNNTGPSQFRLFWDMAVEAEKDVGPRPTAEKEEGEITPLKEDSIQSPQRHPLQHGWTFWFDNPQARGSNKSEWGKSLRAVYTFKTVEEFWCLYNNVITPSKLVVGADFHCFKSGIEPKWEDRANKMGGSWKAVVPKQNKQLLDTYWLNTLLAMIGEQFEEYDEICGAVASVRQKQERMALWTKTADNRTAQMSVGKQWKEVLNLNEEMGFTSFAEEGSKGRSAKELYHV